ncbi:MAG: hypothetical protein WCO60_16895 [Verrucomicrobiota bacterium]
MGAWYQLKCEECGYSARVSAGDASGFFSVVRTMVCKQCHTIRDVTVARLKKGFWRMKPAVVDPGVCSDCEGDLVAWTPESPCPVCGGAIRKGECIGLWD